MVTVSRELPRYILHLVGVQVRWEGSGTAPAGEYTFCMERGMSTMNWVQSFFVHKRIISAVKWAEFVCSGMPYKILRGWRFHIVLNVYAATGDKTDNVKDR
jgi:hypothetical protein